jgi:prepilin-type N-terminal cleavage/methylation domain-containing protein
VKKCNGGYTLVELIVVVAIIGILATVALLSVSSLNSTDAKRCSAELSAMLGECRVDAMSRAGDYYLALSVDEDGKLSGAIYRMGDEQPLKTQTFNSRRLSAAWHLAGQTAQTLSTGQSVYIAFDRATGGVRNFSADVHGTLDTATQCLIAVTGGTRTYHITIDTLTGSRTVEG